MIVTCSNCAARYAVDPLAVGPSGRTVECARCHHRWFQRVEAPPLPPDLVIRPPSPGATAQLPAVIEPKPDFGWNRVLAVAAVVVILLAAAAFVLRQEIMAMMTNEADAGRSHGRAPDRLHPLLRRRDRRPRRRDGNRARGQAAGRHVGRGGA